MGSRSYRTAVLVPSSRRHRDRTRSRRLPLPAAARRLVPHRAGV